MNITVYLSWCGDLTPDENLTAQLSLIELESPTISSDAATSNIHHGYSVLLFDLISSLVFAGMTATVSNSPGCQPQQRVGAGVVTIPLISYSTQSF